MLHIQTIKVNPLIILHVLRKMLNTEWNISRSGVRQEQSQLKRINVMTNLSSAIQILPLHKLTVLPRLSMDADVSKNIINPREA